MMRHAPDAPHLELAGLSPWVRSYQHPDMTDVWDGNWLSASAALSAPGCHVTVDGSFLRSDELLSFKGGLRRLYDTLKGEAALDCLEPNLRCRVTCGASGHVEVAVDLTPDPLQQSHHVSFDVDQT